MRFRLTACLLPLLVLSPGWCSAAAKRAAAPKQKTSESLRPFFESSFPRWDRNGDGSLDMKELNAQIENPNVRGTEAATVFVLRKRIIAAANDDEAKAEEQSRSLTRAQVMALGDDPATQREIKNISSHIAKISRELFLPGDPNLATFHQGRVGDCYFMAVLGAFVYRDPQAVRGMVKPLPGGAYEVRFASGKVVQVPAPTDAELVMCAREGGNHGMWIAVFEKAYGEIRKDMREEKSGAEIEDDDVVTHDLIGGGGRPGPAIQHFTGHKPAAVPLPRWLKEGPDKAAGRLHDLLTGLMKERRLAAAYTNHDRNQKLPVPHGHAFGVVGYDPARRTVRVFNPWGNDRAPSGPPGMQNGYVTRNGIFDVPAKDFVQIFARLVYETDQAAPGS